MYKFQILYLLSNDRLEIMLILHYFGGFSGQRIHITCHLYGIFRLLLVRISS